MNTDGTDSTDYCWALVRFVRFVVNVVFSRILNLCHLPIYIHENIYTRVGVGMLLLYCAHALTH